ncbi:MAG: SLBB domain-containing protein, partial [Firmicutes bacterium]|nr:SLBB domain-containing protein [Bacillota bacterium]
MAHHRRPAGPPGELDGGDGLGHGPDLVQLDEDRVRRPEGDAAGDPVGVRDEDVVADELESIAEAGGLANTANNRKATLVRKDGTKITVDLYEILIKGNPEKEIPLQPGDNLIIELAQYSIIGAVGRSGIYDLSRGIRLSEAIAQAGGVQPKADLTSAFITRGDQTIPLNLLAVLVEKKVSEDITVEPGDIINIPESRLNVAVMGSVRSPGTYPLIPGYKDHLLDLIGEAGGPTSEARTSKITITRGSGADNKVIHIDMAKGGPESNPLLQPGDLINVARKRDMS